MGPECLLRPDVPRLQMKSGIFPLQSREKMANPGHWLHPYCLGSKGVGRWPEKLRAVLRTVCAARAELAQSTEATPAQHRPAGDSVRVNSIHLSMKACHRRPLRP